MGGGAYTHDDYLERAETRAKEKRDVFQYSQDVARGHDNEGRKVERRVHPTLDIHGKIRESCDFNGVPSIPIVYILDVTGSMQQVPPVIQKGLPKAMALLLEHKYTRETPQVLFGAVADSHGDQFPVQIGQFEADIRMEDYLTNMVLGGGGSWGTYSHESYELPLFYLGMRTKLDHFDKRGKKGFAFVFGDEHPYPLASTGDLSTILGVTVEGDVLLEAAIKATKEKFHLFFIIPGGTMHAGEDELAEHWGSLLGDERVTLGEGKNQKKVSPFVIKLDAPELASEATCLIVGLTEGTVPNLEDGLAHLRANASEKTAIRKALVPYATWLAQRAR